MTFSFVSLPRQHLSVKSSTCENFTHESSSPSCLHNTVNKHLVIMQEDQEVDGGEMKGFTIRCKGNSNEHEDVVVSDADAQAMSKKCEYFQNVFAHGTQEAEERIIRKPDLTSSTAKTIVQLLSEGNTTVHSRESFYLLEEAAQQILLNISPRVPAFVSVAKGQHTGVINHAQIESFFNVTEQLNGPQVKVEFPKGSLGIFYDEPISFDDWVTLLDQGIVMKKSDESAPSFRVVLEMNAQPALNYSLAEASTIYLFFWTWHWISKGVIGVIIFKPVSQPLHS